MCSQLWFLTDRRIREDYPQVQILRALRQRCSEQDVRFRAVLMDQIAVTIVGGHLGGHEDFSKMIDEAEPLGYPVVVKSTRGHRVISLKHRSVLDILSLKNPSKTLCCLLDRVHIPHQETEGPARTASAFPCSLLWPREPFIIHSRLLLIHHVDHAFSPL
ncbi:hypothetical protein H8959_006068 [Pygathrix nigripes]